MAAFAIEMAILKAGGPLGNSFVEGALIFFVMAAVSWLVVSLLAQPGLGNRTLCISIGGGLGTILFLNVWGIAWRCQKRLIAWTRAASQQGTPMPPEAASLARLATLTMQINFWLSFPGVFFMAASAHFPFLSGGYAPRGIISVYPRILRSSPFFSVPSVLMVSLRQKAQHREHGEKRRKAEKSCAFQRVRMRVCCGERSL